MAKLVDQGENLVLHLICDNKTLYLGLYLNDPEPAENITLTGLTEPTGGAYVRKVLTAGAWNIVGDLAEYAQQVLTASGADWGNVYGYFITDVLSGTSGNIFGVEHFSNGPYNAADGSNVRVTSHLRGI